MKKMLWAAAAATALVSSAAWATVTVNPDGTGWVGKGDVQTVYGWNNQTMQRNAAGVSFYVASEERYDVTCEWDTVAGQSGNVIHHEVTLNKKSGLMASIQYLARRNSSGINGDFTGWYLLGWDGDPVVSGDGNLPAIGDPCPGNSGGVATQVDLVSSTGGVYASYNGDDRLISAF